MMNAKRDQLDSVVASIEKRFGAQAIMPGNALPTRIASIPTGYDALDNILGSRGVPLSGITLLSGSPTCGKRTLAYKVLANAQHSESERGHVVAIFDLNATTDADYLSLCGVDMEWLTLIRPHSAKESINALLDLVRSRQVRAVLLDDLNQIWEQHGAERYLESILPQLKPLLQNTAVIFLAEVSSGSSSRENRLIQNIVPMVSLHIVMEHIRWIVESNELRGYQAQAQILRAPRGQHGRCTELNIELPQTTLKRETW